MDDQRLYLQTDYTPKQIFWLLLAFALAIAIIGEFGSSAYSVFCLTSSWLFAHFIFIRPLKLDRQTTATRRLIPRKLLALGAIILLPVVYLIVILKCDSLWRKQVESGGILSIIFAMLAFMASPWWLYGGTVLIPFGAFVKKGSPDFEGTAWSFLLWVLTLVVVLIVTRKRGIRSAAILLIIVWSLVVSLVSLSMQRAGYRFDISGFLP